MLGSAHHSERKAAMGVDEQRSVATDDHTIDAHRAEA